MRWRWSGIDRGEGKGVQGNRRQEQLAGGYQLYRRGRRGFTRHVTAVLRDDWSVCYVS